MAESDVDHTIRFEHALALAGLADQSASRKLALDSVLAPPAKTMAEMHTA
jgi:hypothetical protein